MLDPATPCPCGRLRTPGGPAVLPYAACCGRWHQGAEHLMAPDAEALMRSRYSAFVLGLADYLLATWHPATRPATLDLDEPGLRWLGLTVKQHRALDPLHAEVAFVARSKQGGRAHRLQELSRFERLADEQGRSRWFYRDGDLG